MAQSESVNVPKIHFIKSKKNAYEKVLIKNTTFNEMMSFVLSPTYEPRRGCISHICKVSFVEVAIVARYAQKQVLREPFNYGVAASSTITWDGALYAK